MDVRGGVLADHREDGVADLRGYMSQNAGVAGDCDRQAGPVGRLLHEGRGPLRGEAVQP